MDVYKYVGEKIRILREEHSLSQAEIANSAGISLKRLKRIKAGECEFGVILLSKIAKILKTTPKEIFISFQE